MTGGRAPRDPGESISREERLRRRSEYQRCYQNGRRRHGSLVALHFAPNGLGHPRLGVTASRKVGKAVVRNRVKRRIKEIYRRWDDRSTLPAIDLVVHVKPPAGKADFAALEEDLIAQLSRLPSPPSAPPEGS